MRKQANLVLACVGALSAAVALSFAYGAAVTIANHLFNWRADKISIEWSATRWVAAVHGVVALIAAAAASVVLKQRTRKAFWWVFVLIAITVWILIGIRVSRDDPAYLWIIIGAPVLVFYLLLRSWHSLRARGAG